MTAHIEKDKKKRERKKEYTEAEVEKMVDKLFNGKDYSELGSRKLENIQDKIDNEIYPNSNNDAREYLSDVLDEIQDILERRDYL